MARVLEHALREPDVDRLVGAAAALGADLREVHDGRAAVERAHQGLRVAADDLARVAAVLAHDPSGRLGAHHADHFPAGRGRTAHDVPPHEPVRAGHRDALHVVLPGRGDASTRCRTSAGPDGPPPELAQQRRTPRQQPRAECGRAQAAPSRPWVSGSTAARATRAGTAARAARTARAPRAPPCRCRAARGPSSRGASRPPGRARRYMKFVPRTRFDERHERGPRGRDAEDAQRRARPRVQTEAEHEQQRRREHEPVQPEEDDELPAREVPLQVGRQHREQRARGRPVVDDLRRGPPRPQQRGDGTAPSPRRTARAAARSSSRASPRGRPSPARTRRARRSTAASVRRTGRAARGRAPHQRDERHGERADAGERGEVRGAERVRTARVRRLRSGIVRRSRAGTGWRPRAARRAAAGRASRPGS